MVVWSLKNIKEDQIAESMGIPGPCAVKKSLAAQNFTLIVGSAETVLDNRFLHILKDNVSSLHRKLAAVVVDEFHTVEMWAGKSTCF